MTDTKDLEIIAFASTQQWERWLARNHAGSAGVWLRFFKINSKVPSVTHADALNVALSYGWIDGQLKKGDEVSWLRRFAPRRPKSVWSKRNRELVERLTEAGKMRPAGTREVESAKADGRWDGAYDSPSNMTVPEDFLAAIARNKKATMFFQTLNKANTYAIGWRLQTAKTPATREKRLRAIIAMLAAGKRFHD